MLAKGNFGGAKCFLEHFELLKVKLIRKEKNLNSEAAHGAFYVGKSLNKLTSWGFAININSNNFFPATNASEKLSIKQSKTH